VESKSPHTVDIDIGPRDIQALDRSNALAAFFARLGYNTDVRTEQTAGNLGITAEGTAHPIKRIELIADQEGLFQVYLIELASVTVTHTRALGKAFRNRAGNYLLILTSDYERLDFVLLERYLPGNPGSITGIASKQVGIRPRVLTVDRRKPGPIHLRVLRRFTWTESDPFAQYDKLLSAYGVADWSEEFFNNRALFSDYYLLERLPAFPEWGTDPRPSFDRLREIFQGAGTRLAGKGEGLLKKELTEPALQILGFDFKQGKGTGSATAEPDYRLFSPEKPTSPIAVCLAYPWGRSLDGKDDQRDKETPEENPGAVVVSLLEKGEAPWVLMTNGKTWRLYAQQTHSRATNYYEVDLEEILAQSGPHGGDPSTTFRYFWVLFRSSSFEPRERTREGRKISLSLLDQLLLESADYARELGDRLKDRVFEDVFPQLASGFLAYLDQADGLKAGHPQEQLDKIFQGTLTLLYRVLFLLFAEARDLLPVKEVRGYFEASLTKIKSEIADTAGTIGDEVEGSLRKVYTENCCALYDRLSLLFQVIDQGDPQLNVPIYNGGLFLSDPDEFDQSPEAQAARYLHRTKVPDRYLAHAMDLLARDIDPKRQDLVFIDFKSLGVRQLGSIYEGLLEFRLCIADRKLAIIKEKQRELYVPFRELTEAEQERAERQGRIVKKGQAYLENDKSERKATGSYYTPDHIVKYIVENAVGPVLQEKFESMRPKLREAQQKRHAFHRKQEALRKQGIKPDLESKTDLIGKELVDELFNVKVLDPAMGSGHFLVETVDFITDKTLDFLNAFPWNPIFAHLARMRETVLKEMEDQGITIDPKRLTDVNLLKRQVLKRCVYGVDLNPMAVELAKVSLWLDCFTLGAPLSFLDHHLRCGNSLIGVSVQEVREAVEPVTRVRGSYKAAASATEWKDVPDQASQLTLFDTHFTGLLLATDLMRQVGWLSDVTSVQVRASREEYRRASDALAPFKRILDVYTSQWFGNDTRARIAPPGTRRGRSKAGQASLALAFLKSPDSQAFLNARNEKTLSTALAGLSLDDRRIAETALRAAGEKRFFHWELEFPEVFYGPRPGTFQTIERLDGAGFDAVIGNPPYDVLASEELGYDVSEDLAFYEASDICKPAIRGKKNLYKLFICRGKTLMEDAKGALSFIVPMALLGDDQAVGVRRMLLETTGLQAVEAFPQKDDPRKRVFPEAKLSTTVFVTRARQMGEPFTVRSHPGRYIEEASPRLQPAPEEILKFDSDNAPIPTCTERDLESSTRMAAICPSQLGQRVKLYQGEINEAVERPKKTLSSVPVGPLVLRGSCITLYAVRSASQGTDLYLEQKKFLVAKHEESKSFHYQTKRIGLQRKAPQNNFRRLIAAPIPANNFCFESISYCIEPDSSIELDLLLALLNSRVLEWYFRIRSTNAQVNEYQFNALPVPTISQETREVDWRPLLTKGSWLELGTALCSICTEPGIMPRPVADALAEMSRRIQEIEAKRVLKSRSERSHLDPESQPIQDAIDDVLFRCYGLSEEEGRYISERLREML